MFRKNQHFCNFFYILFTGFINTQGDVRFTTVLKEKFTDKNGEPLTGKGVVVGDVDSGPICSNLPDPSISARAFGKRKLLSPAYYDLLVSCPLGAGNPDIYFVSGFGVVNG